MRLDPAQQRISSEAPCPLVADERLLLCRSCVSLLSLLCAKENHTNDCVRPTFFCSAAESTKVKRRKKKNIPFNRCRFVLYYVEDYDGWTIFRCISSTQDLTTYFVPNRRFFSPVFLILRKIYRFCVQVYQVLWQPMSQ